MRSKIPHATPSGPAFLSHRISEGDTLLGVNDVALTATHGKIDDAQIVQLMKGDDIPGSQCRVEFRSAATGMEETVMLTRMCNDLLAHKRQMFAVQERLRNHLQAYSPQDSRPYTHSIENLFSIECALLLHLKTLDPTP